MRRAGRLILVGRNEEPPVSAVERVIHDLAFDQAQRIETVFRWRWPDDRERWKAWNVIALTGTTVWDRVKLLIYDGFGVDPFPTLQGGIDYHPTFGLADPFESSRVDPPILHQSWELFGPGDVDDGNHGVTAGLSERMRTLGRQLDKRGLTQHPLSATQRSWERLLVMRGLRIDLKTLRLEARRVA